MDVPWTEGQVAIFKRVASVGLSEKVVIDLKGTRRAVMWMYMYRGKAFQDEGTAGAKALGRE